MDAEQNIRGTMIIFALFWKEMTLRRKAYIMTFVEVVLAVASMYVMLKGCIVVEKLFIEAEMQGSPFVKGDRIPESLYSKPVYYFPSTTLTNHIMNETSFEYQNNQRMTVITGCPRKCVTLPTQAIPNETIDWDWNNFSATVIFREKNSTKYWSDRSLVENGIDVKIRPNFYCYLQEKIRNPKVEAALEITLEEMFALLTVIDRNLVQRWLREDVNNTKYIYSFTNDEDVIAGKIAGSQSFIMVLPLQMSFLLPLFVLVNRIITEKKTKLHELMRMNGVKNKQYYGVLFIFNFVMLLPISLFTVIICRELCDIKILLIIYLSVTISSILFGMTLTTVFNRKDLGLGLYVTLWIGVPVVIWILYPPPKLNFTEETLYLVLCLFSSPPLTLMMFWRFSSSAFALRAKKLEMNHMFNQMPEYTLITAGHFVTVALAACFVWLILLWYIGEVWPWQEGIPKPFHFPISQWFIISKQTAVKRQNLESVYFEKIPDDLKCGISVCNVRKRFGFGKEVLKGVNLEVFRDEITVLLGHNGAGKTTLMSIMGGMFSPTSGKVIVDGYDVEKNRQLATKNLGFCTQVNIQFDRFTIYEHLYFFGLLKGFCLLNIDPEIDRVLKLLNLTDKKYLRPSAISGGMKRKLQLGMAFIGGSNILILDEPSSGLDVETRRTIWDMLLSVRKKHLILITTHHMEEADVLGDRIAIMSQGEVKCYGSPMFLKRVFDVGYFVRIAKDEKFVAKDCEALLKKHLSSVLLQKNTTNEAIYTFSKDETPKLASLFDELDSVKKQIGIKSVGISVTSMDDVFLKAGVIFEKQKSKSQSSFSQIDISNKGSASYLSALLLKRFHNLRRNIFTVLFFLAFIGLFSFLNYTIAKNQFVFDEWSEPLSFSALGYTTSGPVKGVCFHNETFCTKIKEMGEYFGIEVEFKKEIDSNFKRQVKDDILVAIFVNSTEEIYIHCNHEAIYSHFIATLLVSNTRLAMKYNVKTPLLSYTFNPFRTIRKDFSATTVFPIAIAFYFLSFWPLSFPSAEYNSNAKLLQMMTGVSYFWYWMSNLAFDFLFYNFISIPLFLTIAVFYFVYDVVLIAKDFVTIIIFLFSLEICFLASITLAYLLSFVISSTAVPIILTMMLLVCCNFLVFLPIEPLKKSAQFFNEDILPGYPVYHLYSATNATASYSQNIVYCNHLFTVFPNVCKAVYNPEVFANCCKEITFSIWFPNRLVYLSAINFALFIVFFAAILLVERLMSQIKRYSSRSIYKPPENEDPDVTELRTKTEQIVKSRKEAGYALTALNLTKRFGTQTIVDHLTFSVEKEQCFGLLGVNGAGKTTTFKMLIGDLAMTVGESFIGNLSIFTDNSEYRKQIGYCPQFDAFVSNMTAREILYLFARLRGYRNIKPLVENMIKFIDLQDHASYVADNYSGGNKRKLSIGMTLMGWPKVMFLDEPTAGVDPVARRKLWNIIETAQKKAGSSVILTSHSMDECESLCDIIGIMVKGTFRCMGSTQQLKSKFGKGYTITLKLDANLNNVEAVKNDVAIHLPKTVLKDSHQTMLQYILDDPSASLGNIFRLLENIKQRHRLEDYQLTDADLEQIFLGFAKNQ